MRTAVVNLKTILSGDWRDPFVTGTAILMDAGRIVKIGSLSDEEYKSCDVVIDADGATAIPGLIDSQVHNTFGDYTPRQKTSRVTCMAASPPRSAPPKYTCPAAQKIHKA
jgi:enamidase